MRNGSHITVTFEPFNPLCNYPEISRVAELTVKMYASNRVSFVTKLFYLNAINQHTTIKQSFPSEIEYIQ